MALDPIDSENLATIASALGKIDDFFNPDVHGAEPLYRIALALECIAKSMDSSFVSSDETR